MTIILFVLGLLICVNCGTTSVSDRYSSCETNAMNALLLFVLY